MRFLRTVLKGIRKKKIITIFLLFQFIACYYISLKTYTNYKMMNVEKERVEKVFDLDLTYSIDKNKPNDEDMENVGFQKFLDEIKKIEGVVSIGSYTFDKDREPFKIPCFYINYDMMYTMNLKVQEGELLDETDFKDNYSEFPVLMGEDLVREYNVKVGDTVNVNGNKVQIKGILKQGQEFFIERFETSPLISMDKTMVSPRNVDVCTKSNSYNNNFLIIKSNEIKKDIEKRVDQMSKEKDYPVSFTDIREYMNREYTDKYKRFKSYLRIDIAIIIFALLGVAVTLIMIVNSRKKEFGVRIAVGATKSYLCFMILTEVFILSIVGLFIGLIGEINSDLIFINRIIGQSIFQFFNLKVIGTVILISVVLIGIFSLSAVRQLFKMEPRELIKGRD